jgi:monoamine oxidase
MRWVTKVHCVYPERFWSGDGLSGAAAADDGMLRTTAANSDPAERRATVCKEFAHLFGEPAAEPEIYREKNWGEDAYCRGADGGYWSPRVWTTYGHAIREAHGHIHWAGTETSAVWNGKMEGALLSGDRAAAEVLDSLG